jgi:hypothetical protein
MRPITTISTRRALPALNAPDSVDRRTPRLEVSLEAYAEDADDVTYEPHDTPPIHPISSSLSLGPARVHGVGEADIGGHDEGLGMAFCPRPQTWLTGLTVNHHFRVRVLGVQL